MVDVGPLAPVYCPNGSACPHDIVDHRYEPDCERWVCTVSNCHENPYRIVTVCDSNWSLNSTGYAQRMASLRAFHGPDVTFEFVKHPPTDTDWIEFTESRGERRKRLGLRWWQREPRRGLDSMGVASPRPVAPASGSAPIDYDG